MKKLSLSLCMAALCLVMLGACGSSGKSDDASAEYPMPTMALQEDSSYNGNSSYGKDSGNDYVDSGKTGATSSDQNPGTDVSTPSRKLIKRVSITMETLEFDESRRMLEQQTAMLGGYVEASDINLRGIYDIGKSGRSASYTLRIPGLRLDEFLNSAGSIGNVTYQSMNTEDVTMSYLDTESRKKALEIQQERLLSLLEKAETVEDIISLEDRLSNVTYELEKNQSILKNYDNLVEYSTVEVYMFEVERVSAVIEEQSVGQKMSSGLNDTFYNIGEGFKNFAVWFVVNLPYIIFWGALIAAVIVIIVKRRKKRRIAKIAAGTPDIKMSENDTGSPGDSK